MQVLHQGKVLEEKDVSVFLKIMSNEQATGILRLIVDAPKSALDISQISAIPLTQVYRWIRKLQSLGLVRVSGDTNSAGKKYFKYQSKVNSIKVSLISPEVLLEIY